MQEPLMPDRKADICSSIRARTMLGPATPPAVSSNSIIDGMDMARYHCILDRRVSFNEGDRWVKSFQETDEGRWIAMADSKSIMISNIKHFYGPGTKEQVLWVVLDCGHLTYVILSSPGPSWQVILDFQMFSCSIILGSSCSSSKDSLDLDHLLQGDHRSYSYVVSITTVSSLPKRTSCTSVKEVSL